MLVPSEVMAISAKVCIEIGFGPGSGGKSPWRLAHPDVRRRARNPPVGWSRRRTQDCHRAHQQTGHVAQTGCNPPAFRTITGLAFKLTRQSAQTEPPERANVKLGKQKVQLVSRCLDYLRRSAQRGRVDYTEGRNLCAMYAKRGILNFAERDMPLRMCARFHSLAETA